MVNITVLLSTYNGEKYLSAQLDSVLSQRNVNVRIVIRDDGSTDSTVSLIQLYVKSHPDNITLLKGENIGWRKSFFSLIDYVADHLPPSDYYAFADQDDIWLPEKLISAVESLKNVPNSIKLYFSSLYSYREGEDKSLIRRNVKPTCKNCLVRNYATGCTIVFSSQLMKKVAHKTPAISVPHDHWLYIVARLCGEVVVDETPHILYRQHDNNQIGNKTGIIDIWKRRLKNFSGPESYQFRENISRELYRLYKDEMSEDGRKSVLKVVEYKNSFSNRFKLLADRGYTMGNPINDFFLKCRILHGIF